MTAESAEDQISKAAIEAVMNLMGRYHGKRQRSDAVAGVMLTAYNLMRAIEGDKFTIGWLESAVADVRENPPPFEIREVH